jgi:RNA polymerase-binding transcription factor DksA
VNKSADINDNASELEDQFREAAIEDIRRRNAAPKDFDGESCMECGAGIVEKRLALGFWRCVECQTVIEKRSRSYRT